MDFYESYEARAKARANSVGVEADPNAEIEQGEGFEGVQEATLDAGVQEPEFKLNVGDILHDIDTSADVDFGDNGDVKSGVSEDEMYCVGSFLSGRVGLDDIQDEDAPFLLAAISHRLFGTKNDYNGTILANALYPKDNTTGEWNPGYNKDTGKWDAKTLLGHVKTAWDVIQDKTGQKAKALVNADVAAHDWVKEGDRPFFTDVESNDQLDYQYGIAKSKLGKMKLFEMWDHKLAAGTGTGRGIEVKLTNLFGVGDLLENAGASIERKVKEVGSLVTGDTSGAMDNAIIYHNANSGSKADKFILDRACEELGVSSENDYANLAKAIYDSRPDHTFVGKNGVIMHVSEKNAAAAGASYIWIQSGNDVEFKQMAVDAFVREQADSLGILRMKHAIGLLAGNKYASEGVAHYMSGVKDDGVLTGVGFHDFNGDSDALRKWANEHLDGSLDERDAKSRFNDVQTAMSAIDTMRQAYGFVGSESIPKWVTDVANIPVNLTFMAKDMGVGAYDTTKYAIERGIDKVCGETEAQAEATRKRRMIEQQVDYIARPNVNSEGTVLGFVGNQVAQFLAFELLFKARISPVAKRIPGLRKAGYWLEESKVAKNAARLDRDRKLADKLTKSVDDMLGSDFVLDAEAMGVEGVAKFENFQSKLADMKSATSAQIRRIEELVGKDKSAAIIDKCRNLINSTPSLYTLYASSVDENEQSDAARLGSIMLEGGDGYNDEMWSDATSWAQGKAVVSTGFMMGLGQFFKNLKNGSVASQSLQSDLTFIDSEVLKAIKNNDSNVFKAILGGFNVAAAQIVEQRVAPLAKLGFGMGASSRLMQNLEDYQLGIGNGDIQSGVIEAGVEEAGSMGVGGLAMELPRGVVFGSALARRNYRLLKKAQQFARPDDIISSIIAENRPDYLKPEQKPDKTNVREDDWIIAEKQFSERLGAWRAAYFNPDPEKSKAELEAWRSKNRELCGEEGAKILDAYARDIKYAPEEVLKALELDRIPVDANATVVTRILQLGGMDVASAKDLANGDVEVEFSMPWKVNDTTTASTPAKWLIRQGKIYQKSTGGIYAEGFVADVLKRIDEIRANPNRSQAEADYLAKYDALSDEDKAKIARGEDVNGILDAHSPTGVTLGEKEIREGKESNPNLVDITSPESYAGIVRLADAAADGRGASIEDIRHELLGHGAFEMLRRAKLLTAEDELHLKETFGENWEEKIADEIVKNAGRFDVDVALKMLNERSGGVLSKITNMAKSILQSARILKKDSPEAATFRVNEFIRANLEVAHEAYKLHEQRRLVNEAVTRRRQEMEVEQSEEAKRLRKEAEALYLAQKAEDEKNGHDRSVQIAKQRDHIIESVGKLRDIVAKIKSVEQFDAEIDSRIENWKGDLIHGLKKLGMDKETIGRLIEEKILPRISEMQNGVRNALSERQRKAEADERARIAEEERVAKEVSDRKARLEAERERLEAKAKSKREGEKLAKDLAKATSALENMESQVLANLREFDSVSKFDRANKEILSRFDRLTKGCAPEVVKEMRDELKKSLYEARKRMELKADAIKAKEAEARRITEEAKAKAKAEREAIKREQAEVMAQIRNVANRLRQERRVEAAKARQKARDSELLLKGTKMLGLGMPIPNANIVAGLEGEALAAKKEFMRQCGYYYSAEHGCWVNKNTPKAHNKAKAKAVKEAISDILAVQKDVKKNGGSEFAEELLSRLNSAKGRKTSEAPATSKPVTKDTGASKQDAKKSELDKAIAEQEDFLRQLAVLKGWSNDELESRIKLLHDSVKASDAKADTVSQTLVQQPDAVEQKPVDAQPVVEEAKPITNVMEEKAWWRNQLTPEERLGLGVVYVDGKPWSIVYCPDEIISGNETFVLEKGELPDGAIIKPFNARAFQSAIEKMADDSGYDMKRTVTGELRNSPYFDVGYVRGAKKMRAEAKERAKAEREAKELEEAYKETVRQRQAKENRVMELLREKRDIEDQVKMPAYTQEQLERMSPPELAEASRHPFAGKPEDAKRRTSEIDKELAELAKAVDGSGVDGKFNIILKEGLENIVRFSSDKNAKDAKDFVESITRDFVFGPGLKAMESLQAYGLFADRGGIRSLIPNWMVNQQIEKSGDGIVVTLSNGVKLRPVWSGTGGNTIGKVRKAKESGSVEGLRGEVQFEYAGAKATIPTEFLSIYASDDVALRQARENERKSKDELKKLVTEKLSETAAKKLGKSGVFNSENVELEGQRDWYVSDFFKNDAILEHAYPGIFGTTKVVILDSERTKGMDGKPASEPPLFPNGSLAGLDESGNIVIKPDTESRVRVGDNSRRVQRLSRDIGACVVLKIMRQEGFHSIKKDDKGNIISDDPLVDVSRSASYFSRILNGQRESGKKSVFKQFRLTDDKLLRKALHQVIEETYERNVSMHFTPKNKLEDMLARCDELLDAAIRECAGDFLAEREAILNANRFGLTDEQLAGESYSEAQKAAFKDALIRHDDPRFNSLEKSDAIAQFHGAVLEEIDRMFSDEKFRHSDRSMRKDFDSLIVEFMLDTHLRESKTRLASKDKRLMRLYDYIEANSGKLDNRETVLQREGGKTEEGGTVSKEIVDRSQMTPLEKMEADEAKANSDARTDKPVDDREKKMRSIVNKIDNRVKTNCLDANKRLSQDKIRKVFDPTSDFFKQMLSLIKEANPKFSDKQCVEYLREISVAVLRNWTSGHTELNSDIAGRFNIRGVNVEEELIASVGAKVAWEKAKHRGGNINAMADAMFNEVKAQIMQLGVPEADAIPLARSVIGSAKVVSSEIVGKVDVTVTDAQVMSGARTVAARIRVGNDIYRSFRGGYKAGLDAEGSADRARDIVRRNQLRAVKRAAGYSVSEMNSLLGTDIISDLIRIGDSGFKYADGRSLADDMLAKFRDSYRSNNPDMARATNAELDADPVFRAELAATVSSWLVESAKALSFGQERELAIRDAARIKTTMPPTIKGLTDLVAHHSELLGRNLGKMNVEETLHEIEKMIDAHPKLKADGTVVPGASGSAQVTENARIYQRDILPRLQEYWKYVKECMWFDGQKVSDEIDRLQNELSLSDSDVNDIANLKPSELKAEKEKKRDLAIMKINALNRYGALRERKPGEVMDVFNNDITKDLAYSAEQFLVEKNRRISEGKRVIDMFVNDIDKSIVAGKGWDDLGTFGKVARRFHYFNVPELCLKLSSMFKEGSDAKRYVDDFNRELSMAHEVHNRNASEFEKVMFSDIRDIYGEDFGSFIKHACVPDPKFDRFSRAGWTIPENGGTVVKVDTGRKHVKDNAKTGVKKGDPIYRDVTLAVSRGDAAFDDPTHIGKHLSMANLIYIYAACRQPDMAVNNLIYGRDARYIADIEQVIGAKGIALADRMVRAYTTIRDAVSPVSERVTGMPVMSPNSLYIPLEFMQDKSASRTTRYDVNPFPKFLMNRRFHDGARLREDVDIFSTYTRRSEDAAHYIAFAELADRVKLGMASDKVVTQYHNLLGDKIANSLFSQLNETFNGGPEEKGFGVGFRNFVTATSLGFNPSTSLKQLEGIGGWAFAMNPASWFKMFTAGMTGAPLWNPEIRGAIDELHNSGYFKKFGGFHVRAESVSEPMLMLLRARNEGTGKALNFYQKLKETYREHSMDFIQAMDSLATHWGAGSFYLGRQKFYIAKGETAQRAKELAMADTDYAIQVGQQSSRPEFLHEFQRAGIGGKMLTQFAGPTLVRAGQEIEALHRHFLVDRSQKSFNALLSKVIAGHVICPAMFTFAAQTASWLFGKRDDKNASYWDDFATNLLITMGFGSLGGLFVFGQITEASVRSAAISRSGGSSGGRRKFELPVASKFGSLADGFLSVSLDAADVVSELFSHGDVNPMLIQDVESDAAKLLQGLFPVLRTYNAVENIKNAVEK